VKIGLGCSLKRLEWNLEK